MCSLKPHVLPLSRSKLSISASRTARGQAFPRTTCVLFNKGRHQKHTRTSSPQYTSCFTTASGLEPKDACQAEPRHSIAHMERLRFPSTQSVVTFVSQAYLGKAARGKKRRLFPIQDKAGGIPPRIRLHTVATNLPCAQMTGRHGSYNPDSGDSARNDERCSGG